MEFLRYLVAHQPQESVISALVTFTAILLLNRNKDNPLNPANLIFKPLAALVFPNRVALIICSFNPSLLCEQPEIYSYFLVIPGLAMLFTTYAAMISDLPEIKISGKILKLGGNKETEENEE